jgi:hypothetical protein
MRGLTCRLILLGAAIGVALSISAPFVFMPATLIWRIPWLGEHAYEAILWLLSPTGNEGFLGPLFFLTGPSTLAADAIVWLVWRRASTSKRGANLVGLGAVLAQLSVFLGLNLLM